ncbi:MAG TPA: hypothetical protein VMI75_00285 [Polyangiaceae bacterium]|nr:hypothetical protein [Polyangiaceae bacterium]
MRRADEQPVWPRRRIRSVEQQLGVIERIGIVERRRGHPRCRMLGRLRDRRLHGEPRPSWCAAMCNAAAPPGARRVGTCDAQENDAGAVFIQCAGCGV